MLDDVRIDKEGTMRKLREKGITRVELSFSGGNDEGECWIDRVLGADGQVLDQDAALGKRLRGVFDAHDVKSSPGIAPTLQLLLLIDDAKQMRRARQDGFDRYTTEVGSVSVGRDDEGDFFVSVCTEDALYPYVNDKDGMPQVFVYLNDATLYDPQQHRSTSLEQIIEQQEEIERLRHQYDLLWVQWNAEKNRANRAEARVRRGV